MTTMSPARPAAWATVALASVLALSACASDSGTTDSAASPCAVTATSGAPETTDLVVGTVPVADTAAVFQAKEQGYFDEEGLSVTVQVDDSGAVSLPAILAGSMQVSFAPYPSFMLASQGGSNVCVVAWGVNGTPGNSSVWALPDSGITSPEDLEGKTIAVNATNNVGDILVKADLQAYGVDISKVTFTQLGFGDMLVGLQKGSFDAAWVVEPFQTMFKGAGMTEVLEIYAAGAPAESIPVAGFAMSSQFVQDNPNTAAAFARAMAKANDDLVADPDLARTLLESYSPTPPELNQAIVLPEWVGGLPDAADIEVWNTIMTSTGVLPEPVDLQRIVFSSTAG